MRGPPAPTVQLTSLPRADRTPGSASANLSPPSRGLTQTNANLHQGFNIWGGAPQGRLGHVTHPPHPPESTNRCAAWGANEAMS